MRLQAVAVKRSDASMTSSSGKGLGPTSRNACTPTQMGFMPPVDASRRRAALLNVKNVISGTSQPIEPT